MTIQNPKKPWAVVLMSIEGSTPPSSIPDRFRKLFAYSDENADPTLADFWRDVTQGTVDVSGSEVFGWYDSGFSMIGTPGLSAYPGVTGDFQRPAPIEHAKRVLQANTPGIDLSRYRSFLAVYNFGCDGGYSGDGVVYGIGVASDLSWADVGWRRCIRCSCLVRTAGATLSCSQGGTHEVPTNEPVRFAPRSASTLQSTGGFTACSACGEMFRAAQAAGCPAHGTHVTDGSAFYLLTNWKGAIGDGGWHACSACGALVQGDGSGPCPAAGGKPHTLGSDEFNFPMKDFTYDLRFLGHEMGHAFGFVHSRSTRPDSTSLDNDGFPGAYDDWFDIMSADNCDSYVPALPAADLPGPTGPGLSAHHLLTQGLIPSSSIYVSDPSKPIDAVKLRPVDSPGITGAAVVQVGTFIAELRMSNGPDGRPGWDRALDFAGASAAVLVHDVAPPGPVVLQSTTGNPYLLPGDTFEARVGLGSVRITVNAIDPAGRQAFLAINRYPYTINSWQRWLVLPCRYRADADPTVTLDTLRALMTNGVEAFWRDMSNESAGIHASDVLSSKGDRGDAWFQITGGGDPGADAETRISNAIAQILASQIPTGDGKGTTPFLLDWRWFTGLILANDVAVGDGIVRRMRLPSGNTPAHAGDAGTGTAAGNLTFDVVELGVDAINASSVNRAVGQSLGLATVADDRYHVMSTATNAFRVAPATPTDGIDPAWAPAGPAASARDLGTLGWLGGRDFTVPPPFAGSSTSGSLRLLPLGIPGIIEAGYWRATIGGWTFECRLRRGWDGGLPEPIIVLAQSTEGPPRVLHVGESLLWVGGDMVEASDSALEDLLGGGSVTVTAANASPELNGAGLPAVQPGATITYSLRTGRRIQWGSAVLRGGGTLYFTPRGKIVRIPPGDPMERKIQRAVDETFGLIEEALGGQRPQALNSSKP
jgi:hypothetical protein